ncbi:MAG: hypothetical protein KIT24_03180 [Phycisphaeraceae bacterium]|nr:hypothetical protein [Phycisphaeraceae bacterium]
MSTTSRAGGVRRRLVASAGLVLGATGAVSLALACGPYFPPSVLFQGSARLLTTPIADFANEVGRMARGVSDIRSEGATGLPLVVLLESADEERASFDRSLGNHGVDRSRAEALWAEIQGVRSALYRGDADAGLLGFVDQETPLEFVRFYQGVAALAQGDDAAAHEAWSSVLALPQAERQERTVWARFMLAWLERRSDPASAIAGMREVRRLAAEGFADPCALAGESLGWEAYVELQRGRLEHAASLYLAHLASGDPTAVASLIAVAKRVRSGGAEVWERAARDPSLRDVFTAYVLSWGGPNNVRWWGDDPQAWSVRWLETIERAGVAEAVGAERAAWLAYQAGAFDQALRWAALAEDAPVAMWVQGKVLAARGDLQAAAVCMAKAAAAFPASETWSGVSDSDRDHSIVPRRAAWAEAGALHVARGEFTEALDLLLRAGMWRDAAYVAERVLTPQELKTYVDAMWPAERGVLAIPEPAFGDGDYSVDSNLVDLRHLLGRRLVRLGRHAEAFPYFPKEHAVSLQTLATALQNGRDDRRPANQRAEALWQAAQITRMRGMALMGTELAPDWSIFRGNYTLGTLEEMLAHRQNQGFLSATADEAARFASEPPAYVSRYHYRYVAADLAWEAALLMPDQDEETAMVLCRAGSWLKNRDPEAADRFYKALVRRCGKTPLGREADRLRWFPPLPNDRDEG